MILKSLLHVNSITIFPKFHHSKRFLQSNPNSEKYWRKLQQFQWFHTFLVRNSQVQPECKCNELRRYNIAMDHLNRKGFIFE